MNVFSRYLFTGSDTPYSDARYVIFGVPFDSTTSFRPGARSGPRAIRELSANFESFVPAFSVDFSDIPVSDLGDLEVSSVPDEMVREVQEAAQEIVQDGKVPVMLGGEHTITAAAARAARPDCYVVCDAHLDLREEFRGTVHNHACTTRLVYDDVTHDVIIVGGRSGTADQFGFAKKHLTLFTSDFIREKGMGPVLAELGKRTTGKRVYLSIDADAIDCCLTPGLGTPEPFGLSPGHIRDIIHCVAPHSVAFDYTEVCPGFDHGQAATVAGQLVREFIAAHWTANKQ